MPREEKSLLSLDRALHDYLRVFFPKIKRLRVGYREVTVAWVARCTTVNHLACSWRDSYLSVLVYRYRLVVLRIGGHEVILSIRMRSDDDSK